MSGTEQSAEKSHEATPKKLADARKKGEVARSTDVAAAAGYIALLLIGAGFGAASLSAIGAVLGVLLDQSPALSADLFSGGTQAATGGVLADLAGPVSLWLAGPGVAVLLAIVAQRALVFAPDKLQPRLSRISLIQNAKNKFGRNGWFEFAKSFAKLTVYSVVLALFLVAHVDTLIAAVQGAPRLAVAVMLHLCLQFLGIVILVAVAIAVIDYAWQYHEHLRKHRMSRQEVLDEMKQAEGDPHFKQQRRQRGQEIAMNRMLGDVPQADVVVVNPTHVAVALKWSRAPGAAPECVAKGVDEIALRIRAIAQDSGVPIHRDAPTARALFGAVDIGQEIPEAHYLPVAAAIRYADRIRARAKGRPWQG